MTQSAVFDSSIYVAALRQGDNALLASRRIAPDSLLWLSSVVLEELYAGVRDTGRDLVERLERDFGNADRILVPNLRDWTQTGKVLSRLAVKHHHDKTGRARLTNDALIAASAGRVGLIVITANERDFRLLAEFLPFRWQVASV